MQIKVIPYQKDWPKQFATLRQELSELLQSHQPIIEHFGSTAVPGLAAKPVIDVLVGVDNKNQFPHIVEKLDRQVHYVYLEAFNELASGRRLFIRLKEDTPAGIFQSVYSVMKNIPHTDLNQHRLAHIHIWERHSPEWNRHIAFREYLKVHDTVRQEYAHLKQQLSQQEWEDGLAYNQAKNDFIKKEEKKTIAWFAAQNKT